MRPLSDVSAYRWLILVMWVVMGVTLLIGGNVAFIGTKAAILAGLLLWFLGGLVWAQMWHFGKQVDSQLEVMEEKADEK